MSALLAPAPVEPSAALPIATGADEPTEVRLVGVDAQVVSPAWELELIVTGIVLVGLFQTPPWIDGLWRHWEPHLSLAASGAGRAVVMAVDAALYALIICFVVTLALRGYWVALVGANSVFPHGVRWDKQREYGPIQADLARGRVRPLPTFIGRANDAASMVFAMGFVLAASALASLGFAVVALALFAAVLAVLQPVVAALVIGALLLAVLAVVLGAAVIDMRRGATLTPGSRPERTVRFALRVMNGITPDGVRSLSAVLTSNVNKRVAYAAAVLGLGGAYLAASQNLLGNGLPGRSNYTYFAEDRRGSVITADLYESLRGADDASMTLPSIQSDVVTDPYVRLFVPYRPGRHEAELRRVCPALRPPPADGGGPSVAAADDTVLACAAKLHAVTLDGRRVAAAAFRFFTNPRTERRGFLMLIPASDLHAGEHVLTVQPARRRWTAADTVPIRIPFWR